MSEGVFLCEQRPDVIAPARIEHLLDEFTHEGECFARYNYLDYLDLPGKCGEHQLRNQEVFYGKREQADAGISA